MEHLGDDLVQLYPQNEDDIFPFLVRTTQQWQFLANALALEIPGITTTEVSAVATTRDLAVKFFNEWTMSQAQKQWFRVLHWGKSKEDFWDDKEGTILTAGTKLLFCKMCEQVLAHIKTEDFTLFNHNNDQILIGQKETVELHCVVAPTGHDELRVLPLEAVPHVTILNH